MTPPPPPSAPNLQVDSADSHTGPIINALTSELARPPAVADFSPQAASEFLTQSGEMSKAIGIDAIRLARMDDADYVSEKHVKRAAERLVPKRASRWPEILLVFGGIVAGAAFQEAIDKTILSEADPTKAEVGIIFLLSALGIVMLIAGFYRKR